MLVEILFMAAAIANTSGGASLTQFGASADSKLCDTFLARLAKKTKGTRGFELREPRLEYRDGRLVTEKYYHQWGRDFPFRVTRDGVRLPLALSHDTEISMGPAVKLVRQDGTFKGLFKKYRTADLAKIFGVSETHFRNFGIRKEKRVPVCTDLCSVLELSGSYIDKAFGLQPTFFGEIKPDPFQAPLQDLVDQHVGDAEVGFGGSGLELRYRDSTENPYHFYNHLQRLRVLLGEFNSHFHVGIPSSHASPLELLFLARVLEARMILQMTLDRRFVSTSESSLFQDPRSRGLVAISENRFPTPVLSHDLELRGQYDFLWAFDNLDYAVNLLQKDMTHLRSVPDFVSSFIPDGETFNLTDALKFTAMLMRKDRGKYLGMAEHLEGFVRKTERAGRVSEEVREEVAETLSELGSIQELFLRLAFEQKRSRNHR